MPSQIKVAHFIVGHPLPHIKEVDDDLKVMQDMVNGYIEQVPMPSGLVAIVNEDGRSMKLPVGFAILSVHGAIPICGNFFICRQSGSKYASIRDSDYINIITGVLSK